MKKTSDGIRVYAERLQPQIRLFYRAAHAITGNRRLAERVLSDAALNAYLNRSDWRERMSFREGVLRAIWEESREQLRREPDADWDWTGIFAEAQDEGRPLIGLLAGEAPEIQRSMLLRFGCGLTAKEIAFLTGETSEKVRDQLVRCQTRIERELQKREEPCKPFERYAARALRAWMNRENSEAIDTGYFLQMFERDAVGASRPRRIFAKVIKGFFTVIGALILAVGVWLIAVLMEM